MAGAELVRVNLRHRRDEPLQQRFLGHFQAEHGDRMAAANGDVFHQVQRQRGFSLRRPRGKNEQLRRLQAGGELVRSREAGGNPGTPLPSLKIPSRRSKLARTMSFTGIRPAGTRSSASGKMEGSAPARMAAA